MITSCFERPTMHLPSARRTGSHFAFWKPESVVGLLGRGTSQNPLIMEA
jgi:hypothetical protein